MQILSLCLKDGHAFSTSANQLCSDKEGCATDPGSADAGPGHVCSPHFPCNPSLKHRTRKGKAQGLILGKGQKEQPKQEGKVL